MLLTFLNVIAFFFVSFAVCHGENEWKRIQTFIVLSRYQLWLNGSKGQMDLPEQLPIVTAVTGSSIACVLIVGILLEPGSGAGEASSLRWHLSFRVKVL